MTESTTLKERLARRETWTQIVGYALAILWPFAHLWLVKEFPAPVDAEIIAAIHAALAAGIIGAGTVAQITRAEQRAEDAFYSTRFSTAGGGSASGTAVAHPANPDVAGSTPAPAPPYDDPHATTPMITAPMPPPKNPLPAHVANLERRLQRLEHPLAAPAPAQSESPVGLSPAPAPPPHTDADAPSESAL